MENTVRRRGKKDYKRCAFTGYRPIKMPFGYDETSPQCAMFKDALMKRIEGLIAEGYAHFISGGAMGMDIFAAEAVMKLRNKYPWIMLEMVSPFDGQAARWSPSYKKRHDALFAAADKVTVISHGYTPNCIFMRNRYMVINCDLLLAAYDGQDGGTRMTVDLAGRCSIPVEIFWPFDEEKLPA